MARSQIKREIDRIERLRQRKQWLENRVALIPNLPRTHYMRMEISALEYAIGVCEEYLRLPPLTLNDTTQQMRGCIGKRKYSRRAVAVASARYRSKRIGQYLEAYKCRFCQHWHLGHPPTKKEKKT